jgi:hypothetical protein
MPRLCRLIAMDNAEPRRLGLLGSVAVLLAALLAMAWLYIMLIGVKPSVGGGGA